jgi:Cation transporter/ATPase, N-terminus
MQHLIEASPGLSAEIAAQRLVREGPNALPSPQRRRVWKISLDVVREPMFILLIVGGMVYLALGDQREAMFLLLFGAFSVVITVVQESRSERVLEALRELSSPHAEVLRDGKRIQIDSREVAREKSFLLGTLHWNFRGTCANPFMVASQSDVSSWQFPCSRYADLPDRRDYQCRYLTNH